LRGSSGIAGRAHVGGGPSCRLFLMGRAGLEPATLGLKVRREPSQLAEVN
jgi:hypothetical protein